MTVARPIPNGRFAVNFRRAAATLAAADAVAAERHGFRWRCCRSRRLRPPRFRDGRNCTIWRGHECAQPTGPGSSGDARILARDRGIVQLREADRQRHRSGRSDRGAVSGRFRTSDGDRLVGIRPGPEQLPRALALRRSGHSDGGIFRHDVRGAQDRAGGFAERGAHFRSGDVRALRLDAAAPGGDPEGWRSPSRSAASARRG